MNKSSRFLAVALLLAVCGALAWLLASTEDAARRSAPAIGAPAPSEPSTSPAPAMLDGAPARGGQLATDGARNSERSAASAEARTAPDQLELRRELAAAETRHLEAMEAAFAALRESRGPGCIEGWRDESGELRLDAPAPPQPCLVRFYDLPADPAQPAPDPAEKGASQGAPRVRVLAVHLTHANAPQVFAAQAEAERLRARLR